MNPQKEALTELLDALYPDWDEDIPATLKTKMLGELTIKTPVIEFRRIVDEYLRQSRYMDESEWNKLDHPGYDTPPDQLPRQQIVSMMPIDLIIDILDGTIDDLIETNEIPYDNIMHIYKSVIEAVRPGISEWISDVYPDAYPCW